jgi:sirohydrochlorin ferrochelatase
VTSGVVDSGQPALVAVSHGTNDPAGRRAVASLVAAVSARAKRGVHAAFVDVQQPDVADALARSDSEERPAVIVPLLLSAGFHVNVDLARAAALAAPREVSVAAALGPDLRLARILARRLGEAGLLPGDSIVLAAAGSTDAGAVSDCFTMGALLSGVLGGRAVSVGFMSAAEPRLTEAIAAAKQTARGRVVVASYLLAPGYFAGLARSAGADLVSAPLLAVGAEPPEEIVDIVLDRYAVCARRPALV